MLIILLITVTSLCRKLSKIFSLALECRSCCRKVRRNIFNFVISLLELHCIRILWSYTQISGHKLISIRIGRALLKINSIFVKQIYICVIQILIFNILLLNWLAIHFLHRRLFPTESSILSFLGWPFWNTSEIYVLDNFIRFFLQSAELVFHFRRWEHIVSARESIINAKWIFL